MNLTISQVHASSSSSCSAMGRQGEYLIWHATCTASKKPLYNVHHVHQTFAFMRIGGERYSFITFTLFTTFTRLPP